MLIIETADKFLPEKIYTFNVLLRQLLGVEYEIRMADRADYLLRLPNGGTLIIEDQFFKQSIEGDYLKPENIPAAAETVAQPYHLSERLTVIHGRPKFIYYKQSINCGIDVFASTFFMLTRWEEYVHQDCDEHGRFCAKNALAWRSNFLDRPVVNEYANLLWDMLVRLGWHLPRPERQYRLQLTHDVDYPQLWASPLGRLRTLGGSLWRRRQPREGAYWLKKHFFRRQDPYDTFDELMDLAEKNGQPAHFNFLGERPKSSNAWYSLNGRFVKNLVKKVTERGHVVGFHPSYEAYDDPQAFERELASLRRVTSQPVTSGRQHFLRFTSPETWQRWDNAGLDWDSSLGYSEASGFRAGICDTFPVFNFLTRQELSLREKPLIAMDVTLAHYEQLNPEQGAARLEQLRREVRKHQGEFTLLWHNSSWNTYFWAAWQEVYRSFVADTSR